MPSSSVSSSSSSPSDSERKNVLFIDFDRNDRLLRGESFESFRFKSVKELGVVVVDPPNKGLLKNDAEIRRVASSRTHLAPSGANDVAKGVDGEVKPWPNDDLQIFANVWVKDALDAGGEEEEFEFRSLLLNCPNKRRGVDGLRFSLDEISSLDRSIDHSNGLVYPADDEGSTSVFDESDMMIKTKKRIGFFRSIDRLLCLLFLSPPSRSRLTRSSDIYSPLMKSIAK